MTTTKIATVTITETRTAFEVLAAGTYRVEMPADYDAATVTGEDILYDNAIRIVDDEDEERMGYPSAGELDSAGYAQSSGWRADLYLVPAEESEDGVPYVTMHSGLGNIGTPEPAFCGRWTRLGSYGPQTVGDSVLGALQTHEEELVALAESYQGRRWDGHNMRGSWDLDAEESPLGGMLDSDNLRHYWTADDWYGPAGIGWEELCAEAKVDPERALGNDWEAAASEVAAIVEAAQDEEVSGTEDYALEAAREWRAAQPQNHYAIIANRGSDTAEAIEVWTSLHDSGHPDVVAEAHRRVTAHGGFGRVTWVFVDDPCEAGDTLDVSDDGVATLA